MTGLCAVSDLHQIAFLQVLHVSHSLLPADVGFDSMTSARAARTARHHAPPPPQSQTVQCQSKGAVLECGSAFCGFADYFQWMRGCEGANTGSPFSEGSKAIGGSHRSVFNLVTSCASPPHLKPYTDPLGETRQDLAARLACRP